MKSYKVKISKSANQDIDNLVEFLFTKLSRESSYHYIDIMIQEANNPQMAKRIGKKVKLREDWEDVKVSLMREIVEVKFIQNKEIRDKLIKTYPSDLIEENTWNDRTWGVCKGKGKNLLGIILMEVRDKFIKEENNRE